MLRQISLLAGLARADAPFDKDEGFSIDSTVDPVVSKLTVKDNTVMIGDKFDVVGRNCTADVVNDVSRLMCTGANVYASAGETNDIVTVANNYGEYNIVMTYTDTMEPAPAGGLGPWFWMSTHTWTFNDVVSESYGWKFSEMSALMRKPLIKSQGIYNLRITEGFTKVEVGVYTDYSKYNDRLFSQGWSSDPSKTPTTEAPDPEGREGEDVEESTAAADSSTTKDETAPQDPLEWILIGQDCARPQKSIPKDFLESFSYNVDDESSDNFLDCYVAYNEYGKEGDVEGAMYDRPIWTRIRFNKVAACPEDNPEEKEDDTEENTEDCIKRPHAKITGRGSLKFGIDLFIPNNFDYESAENIEDALPETVPDFFKADRGNKGLYADSGFKSHWDFPNDYACGAGYTADQYGGKYAKDLEDLINTTHDEDHNYKSNFGFSIRAGKFAMYWNKDTAIPNSRATAHHDVAELWAMDFSACQKYDDYINSADVSDDVKADVINDTSGVLHRLGYNTKWCEHTYIVGHEQDEPGDEIKYGDEDNTKRERITSYPCFSSEDDYDKSFILITDNLYVCNGERKIDEDNDTNEDYDHSAGVSFTGPVRAYVNIEMANSGNGSDSQFRFNNGNLALGAARELLVEAAEATEATDTTEATPAVEALYKTWATVTLRNCLVNDTAGRSDYWNTYDMNCMDVTENATSGKERVGVYDVADAGVSSAILAATEGSAFYIRQDMSFTNEENKQNKTEFYFGQKDNNVQFSAWSYASTDSGVEFTANWQASCSVPAGCTEKCALACTTDDAQTFTLKVVYDALNRYGAAALVQEESNYILYIHTCKAEGGLKMPENSGYDVNPPIVDPSNDTTRAPGPNGPKKTGKSNIGVIVGSVIGVAVACGVGGGGYYYYKKRGNDDEGEERVTADEYKNSNVQVDTYNTEVHQHNYFDDSV